MNRLQLEREEQQRTRRRNQRRRQMQLNLRIKRTLVRDAARLRSIGECDRADELLRAAATVEVIP